MGAWHFPREIFICDNQNGKGDVMVGYIRHELTHELQDCRGDSDETCLDRMKIEVEAYKAGGYPTWERAFQGAVVSSCYVDRCSPEQITDELAAAMKIHYDKFP